MDRVFKSGASATPPSLPSSPSVGYAVGGDPGLGTPATKPGPYWYHMITEELRGLIAAAGLTPDAANLNQLTLAVQELIRQAAGDYKASVHLATTGNITALNGGAPNTLDGVALVTGDRILVKNQSTASQNGIYVVTTVGTGANGVWTRAPDGDEPGDLTSGAVVAVEEGVSNADSQWMLTTNNPIVIGTTALVFVRKDASTDSVNSAPSVRQTVLSGPVDSNGNPTFGGSTGSATLTASGSLRVTAANGPDNRTGVVTNPSWTGLNVNGTMWLYVDVAADGVCTMGSTALQPTYRDGGADVVTNGQNTFNIQEMQMKVGNGSSASQVWRTFVGEVTVAGNVVTAITWYALMGRFSGVEQGTAYSSAYSQNHNIGVQPRILNWVWVCKIADNGYAVGDELPLSLAMTGVWASSKTSGFSTMAGISWAPKAGGAFVSITLANWKAKPYIFRGW